MIFTCTQAYPTQCRTNDSVVFHFCFALQFKRIMMSLVGEVKKRPNRTHRWFVVVLTIRLCIWAPFSFISLNDNENERYSAHIATERKQRAHGNDRDMIYRLIRMLTCCGDGNSLGVSVACVHEFGTTETIGRKWCRWSRRSIECERDKHMGSSLVLVSRRV